MKVLLMVTALLAAMVIGGCRTKLDVGDKEVTTGVGEKAERDYERAKAD